MAMLRDYILTFRRFLGSRLCFLIEIEAEIFHHSRKISIEENRRRPGRLSVSVQIFTISLAPVKTNK